MKINIFFFALFLVCMSSCGKDSEEIKKEDILVSCGNSLLTRGEVVSNLPAGIPSSDSIAMAKSYIERWIDEKLMSEIGIRNIPDLERIEKMTSDYRNRLIAYEYRRRMILSESALMQIPEDSLKAYYDAHKQKFVLESPIIKGIYIKISENADRIADVRRWYKSEKMHDIEKLEKYGLNGAINYDYFRDRWVDLSDIEKKIPQSFPNPDNFVKTHKSYELIKNGFVYLLNITEYLVAGDVMPYDYAKPKIKEIFVNANQIALDRKLRNDLRSLALESGDLKINIDNVN